MRNSALALICFVFVSFAPAVVAEQKDAAGCKDHPLFTRMPDHWIYSCNEKEFDVKTFTVAGGKKQEVEGRTSVIVAHRLSTIQRSDKIIVMHKGRVREVGSHQQLLAQRGIYWKLYQLQYKDQEVTVSADD